MPSSGQPLNSKRPHRGGRDEAFLVVGSVAPTIIERYRTRNPTPQ